MHQIHTYFWSEVYMYFSDTIFRELIWSEILFDTQNFHPDIDGSAIILWYQKVFDIFVENSITKSFRKYVHKGGRLRSHDDTHLEKSLFQVIEKGFILSAGRLYEFLKNHIKNTPARYCEQLLRNYIDTNMHIKQYICTKYFISSLETLIRKKILWEKRHSGCVSKKDTQIARKLYIWNLQEQESLLLLLGKIESWGKEV